MKRLVIIMLAALTLTGCDKEEKNTVYTVTFDTDGGIPIPQKQTVDVGGIATEPANPTKQGYIFMFWSLNGTTTAYNFQTPVNKNITLVAKWEKEGSNPQLSISYTHTGEEWLTHANGSIYGAQAYYKLSWTPFVGANTYKVTVLEGNSTIASYRGEFSTTSLGDGTGRFATRIEPGANGCTYPNDYVCIFNVSAVDSKNYTIQKWSLKVTYKLSITNTPGNPTAKLEVKWENI